MGIKVTNNAWGLLSANITDSDTTISLLDTSKFPVLGVGDYFYGTLINFSNELEIVKVTAIVGLDLTVERGAEGTAPRAYNLGERFELRVTAQTVVDLFTQNSIDAALSAQAAADALAAITIIADDFGDLASAMAAINQAVIDAQTAETGALAAETGALAAQAAAELAAALIPIPTLADVGKILEVNPSGNGYQLVINTGGGVSVIEYYDIELLGSSTPWGTIATQYAEVVAMGNDQYTYLRRLPSGGISSLERVIQYGTAGGGYVIAPLNETLPNGIVALTQTDVAFVVQNTLQLWRLTLPAGTWAQVGVDFPTPPLGSERLAALNCTDVILTSSSNVVRGYRWDENTTSWSNLGLTGVSIPFGDLTAISDTDFVALGMDSSWTRFRLTGTVVSQVGTGRLLPQMNPLETSHYGVCTVNSTDIAIALMSQTIPDSGIYMMRWNEAALTFDVLNIFYPVTVGGAPSPTLQGRHMSITTDSSDRLHLVVSQNDVATVYDFELKYNAGELPYVPPRLSCVSIPPPQPVFPPVIPVPAYTWTASVEQGIGTPLTAVSFFGTYPMARLNSTTMAMGNTQFPDWMHRYTWNGSNWILGAGVEIPTGISSITALSPTEVCVTGPAGIEKWLFAGAWYKIGSTVQTPFGNGAGACVALTPTRVAISYPTNVLPNSEMAVFEFNVAYPTDWTMVGNPIAGGAVTALNAYDVVTGSASSLRVTRFDGTNWTLLPGLGSPAIPAGSSGISITGATALNGADVAVAYDHFPIGPATPPFPSGFSVIRWDGAAWTQVSGHFNIDFPQYDVKNLMAVTETRITAMCGFYNPNDGGVLTFELTPSSLPTLPLFDPV